MGHKIEIFSAGCAICKQTVDAVRSLVGADDEVTVHDMHEKETAIRANQLGIRSLPALIIDDKLTGCCAGGLFGVGHPPVSEPVPSESHTDGTGSSSDFPTDRPGHVSTDHEKIEAELRSEMYAGLVGLTFGEEKATSVERLRKACCKLNDLTVKTTLTSLPDCSDE